MPSLPAEWTETIGGTRSRDAATAKASGARSRLYPPLAEVLFAAMLLWLLVGGQASALLADGDTGWHIRAGEQILAERRVPATDPFSFSRPGEPWFAWEWGSDVILALAHGWAGLGGVALLAGILIAAASATLFQFLLWRGVNVVVAVLAVLAAGSASAIHWLARPHLFTSLLFVVSLWLLEADRRRPGGRIWMLLPLAAVWANLHGGFGILPAAIGAYLLGSVVETLRGGAPRSFRAARRYAGLALAVSAATLLNPYGYGVHLHIWQYLRSDFIRNRVEEFQSPRFRGESMYAFEVLLLLGLMAAARLWKRREYAPALLVVGLAHAALGSVRHVPLYVMAATPAVAQAAGEFLLRQRGPGGKALASLAADLSPRAAGRLGPPIPVLSVAATALAAAVLGSGHPRWRVDFPKEKFPQAALTATEEKLVGRRVFTSDQWGDYLIYRYYPRMRVFIDGRSDFYGPQIGRQYLELMQGGHRWEETLEAYDLDRALLPAGWPLATLLKAHPDWRLEYDDGQALVLTRVGRVSVPSANETKQEKKE